VTWCVERNRWSFRRAMLTAKGPTYLRTPGQSARKRCFGRLGGPACSSEQSAPRRMTEIGDWHARTPFLARNSPVRQRIIGGTYRISIASAKGCYRQESAPEPAKCPVR
jgi:hypothetical protein